MCVYGFYFIHTWRIEAKKKLIRWNLLWRTKKNVNMKILQTDKTDTQITWRYSKEEEEAQTEDEAEDEQKVVHLLPKHFQLSTTITRNEIMWPFLTPSSLSFAHGCCA